MGATDKLKAVLRLDTTQFRRDAKKAKGDVNDIGDEAERTSSSASASFAKIGLSITAVGAVAVEAVTKIKAIGDAIAMAADEAARAQGMLSKGLAQELGGPDITRVAALYRESPAQFNIRARRIAERYDMTPQQAVMMLEPLGARIADPGQRAAALPSAAMLGRTRGVFGTDAGDIPALLSEQFDATTQEQFARQTAGIAEAAEQAAFPAQEFGGVMTTVAESMKRGGASLEDIVSDIGGFSLFFPKRPERVATALLQVSDLRNRKSPYLKTLLASQGIDPETKSINQIMKGVVSFIQGGGDVQELQQKGQFPFEVIRAVEKMAGGAFQKKRAATRAAFRRGFGDPGVETRRFDTALDNPGSRSRRAEIAAGTPEAVMGEAGTVVGAQDVLQMLQSRELSDISRESRLVFLQDTNEAQLDQFASIIPGVNEDPTFSADEAKRLQANNALFPRIVAALNSVAAAGEGGMSRMARLKAAVLRNASRAANRIHLSGNQKTEADKFNNVLRDSIQFLQQVSMGKIPTRGYVATEAQRTAASGAEVGGETIGEITGVEGAVGARGDPGIGGGTVINSGVTIFNDRGTSIQQNAETRTTKPKE